jgi:hypothetical protein
MTLLADYDVTVVLVRGDERREITVRLPAAGEDLAVAAGYELADSISEASMHEWRRADRADAVTAVSAAGLAERFLDRLVDAVLYEAGDPPAPPPLPGPDEG